jgi:hypothetical protein
MQLDCLTLAKNLLPHGHAKMFAHVNLSPCVEWVANPLYTRQHLIRCIVVPVVAKAHLMLGSAARLAKDVADCTLRPQRQHRFDTVRIKKQIVRRSQTCVDEREAGIHTEHINQPTTGS